MSREKRKNRLDKASSASSSGEFLGFGAFAEPRQMDDASLSSSIPQTSIVWSPVYNGSDRQLAITFKKIGQKRDGSTKTKALIDIKTFFTDENQNKKDQISALTHLLFIFHARLFYDDFASVRAAALSTLDVARERLPKVWKKLLDRHEEVKGMIWCSQADPSSEVKISVQAISKSLSSDDWSGVWAYVSRTLTYSRPKVMYDDLFARKSSDDSLSDSENEQLDERFERVVGTALSGLTLWIQSFPETEIFEYSSYITDSILWKPLTSARNSFRRKAYQLLGALCLHAKSLVYGPNGSKSLPSLLPNIVAQEKDPTNVPHVFDVLLMYLTSGTSISLSRDKLVKPINKMLRKACFGASALGWAPALLPLIVSINENNLVVSIISSLLEGCTATNGVAHKLAIVSAVAECSCYFLIRSQETDSNDVSASEAVAVCWLKALNIYLCTQAGSPNSRDADLALEIMLGKTLCRLDEVSFVKEDCGMWHSKEWFWTEMLPSYLLSSSSVESNFRLKNLFKRVAESRRAECRLSHLFPLVRRQFSSLLSNFHSTPGVIPSESEYELLQICLEFNTPVNLFDSSKDSKSSEMELFLMNDLLRWIVTHTSRLATIEVNDHVSRDHYVKHDFSLLRVCLDSVDSFHTQKSLWETFLREIIASKCDLGLLALGLRQVCLSSLTDVVRCETLDNFAILVLRTIFQDGTAYRQNEIDVFLRTCSGLHDELRVSLVGKNVWSEWVEIASSNNDNPAVMGVIPVLLDLISGGHLPSSEECISVIMTAWAVGGKVWENNAIVLLKNCSEELHVAFQHCAAAKLRDLLNNMFDAEFGGLRGNIEVQADNWTQRALRWLKLHDSISGLQKLEGIGLANLEIWSLAAKSEGSLSEVLLHCILGILIGLGSDTERFTLVFGDDEGTERVNIFAKMMTVASGSELSVLGTTRNCSKCGTMLSLLGGRALFSDTLVYHCAKAIIREVEDSLLENGLTNWTRRSVNATSEFVSAMRKASASRQRDEPDDLVHASSLKKGDIVWYVAKSENQRDKAEIVSVHSEDFPSLYFTVRVEGNGAVVEKQTVAERLRSKKPSNKDQSSTRRGPSTDDAVLLTKIYHLLVDKIVKPTLTPDEVSNLQSIDAGAQCFRLIQSGRDIIEKPGIGSLHYELSQVLLSLQTGVIEYIETAKYEQAGLALRGLALALGAGERSSEFNFQLDHFRLDPEPLLAALMSSYNAKASEKELYLPTLMWACVALSPLADSQLSTDIMKMILLVVIHISFKEIVDGFFMVRALTQVFRHPNRESGELENEAVSKVVSLLALEGDSDDPDYGHDSSRWLAEPLESLIDVMHENNKATLRDACRLSASNLFGALTSAIKRWLAFRLLQLASKDSKSFNPDATEEMLPRITQGRLQHWKKSLSLDEADELNDAILTVFEWVPSTLMVEMESWIEDSTYFDEAAENITISRMLCWLIFLQYLESSAEDDSRNRVDFSLYASKSGCVFFILSACVIHLTVDFDRKSLKNTVVVINDIISNRDLINVVDLAQSVLFHTMEVFPTLSRKWWEEDCPKALSSTVSKFVQVIVAPETLRRELERINEAMQRGSAGEMTVKGSLISREITATYQQDECTLSIAIQIPPNFPFRSVDVDGRKTLGISESRVKRWALQMRQILNNQDGTLLDALKLWKRYVEKEFEGVEPCPVCYSVLAVKSHELPNMQCKTCANTFHTSCLQKWFASSGKSHCVVCQQPWSGVKSS